MSDEIQSSGPDLNAIADRMFPSSVPSTAQPAVQPATQAAKPATPPATASTSTPEQDEAQRTALREGIARQNREADRTKTPIADRMWAKDEPAATDTQQLAEVPDAIKALRDDPLRRLFSPQGTFASVAIEDAMKNLPIDGEAKAAEAAEWREQFEDFGASPQDAKELVDSARRFVAEPMTPQRDTANVNAAIEMLNQHFGNDATQALRDAQEMVKRDPRLGKILDQSRLGNDPATVLKLARLARSQKMRG